MIKIKLIIIKVMFWSTEVSHDGELNFLRRLEDIKFI